MKRWCCCKTNEGAALLPGPCSQMCQAIDMGSIWYSLSRNFCGEICLCLKWQCQNITVMSFVFWVEKYINNKWSHQQNWAAWAIMEERGSLTTVWVSYICCNKWPQTSGLHTTGHGFKVSHFWTSEATIKALATCFSFQRLLSLVRPFPGGNALPCLSLLETPHSSWVPSALTATWVPQDHSETPFPLCSCALGHKSFRTFQRDFV